MSMATPTLISTIFICVRQVYTHEYDTNAYAHLYFYNMGTATSKTTAMLITLYEYGYAYAHLYYFYMGTASLRSSVSMTLTPTLISIFIIWVQPGLWLRLSHYMSMATPTLISTIFFYLNAASLQSSYAIWVWQRLGYAHLYFIIDYYMGTASLDSSSAYEYGDTFAHLDANIIWVWQIYTHRWPMSLAVPTFIPTLLLYGYGESTLIVSGFPAAVTACSEFWNLAACLGYTVVFSTGHYSSSEQVFPASTANVPRHSYKGGILYSTSWSPGVWRDRIILLPHICSSPAA